MIKEKIIFGIHSVQEALDAGQELDKIYLRRGIASEEIRAIKNAARKARVPVMEVPTERLNRFTRGAHQGCVAVVAQVSYTRLEMLIPHLYEEGIEPLVVVLDGITDTRNFGAIARSAECAGAHALVIPERGSVSVTADAVKASAGALMRIPVCRVPSIPGAVGYLKDSGLSVVVANEKAHQNYYETELTGPIALVLGNEHEGVSVQVARLASHEVAIPLRGDIGSLNVSVAGGILLFEIVRQQELRDKNEYRY
ncbi:23S rRNA (guanosine(2251)-2'-O)-methyltransferase RlmB [Porphyromonas circumdentaria]|uniref:23S rRNA (Guanosine2251-2'-O)-methyltransferase n=1 Tax=Porphyromonas circumdentaria TaxID=29524 RepID=A0A1T4MS74_9PORP|nr:23S rRNA (guanosine(2251)-2'-O)-methyltransferase RlmB [Porphyromonas circumdentaria]MBB6275927.1 23S rRNA (guanosine2251-2'-O)-methyltransferase [Porphyromonas circumdentaria]SJZ69625.1 23S rRNA (guanosine2251-2'-O)-methyltransferase [Porphyromonas circumdentaria]